MSTTLVDPLHVTSALSDGRLTRRARRLLADHDLLVGEFLDEELQLLDGSWGTSRHDQVLRAFSAEVVARHRDAFWVPIDAGGIEDQLLAELIAPHGPRLSLHLGDAPDPTHVFAPRDRMVLHDEVDPAMGLHLVACRSPERARTVVAGLLSDPVWTVRTIGSPDQFDDLLADAPHSTGVT